jgi:hypothetical protein
MTASILMVLLVLAPALPESARFTIRQNGQVIGTEEFNIKARGKGYFAEGRTQLQGDPNALISRMELDENLIPTSYEYSHGAGTIRVRIDSKSSELIVTENGEASSTDFRFPTGASIVDNNFFHHYLLLLYRVKGTSDKTISIFVPQDMLVGQAHVRATASRTYALEVGDVKLDAIVDAEGRLLRLTVPSANVVVER